MDFFKKNTIMSIDVFNQSDNLSNMPIGVFNPSDPLSDVFEPSDVSIDVFNPSNNLFNMPIDVFNPSDNLSNMPIGVFNPSDPLSDVFNPSDVPIDVFNPSAVSIDVFNPSDVSIGVFNPFNMSKDKIKNKRSSIAFSTHCSSFGVSEPIPLREFMPPIELKDALNNYHRGGFKDNPLCNNYIKLINNLPKVQKIVPEDYLVLFKLMLCIEDHVLQKLIAEHNLDDQNLSLISTDAYKITVPTLDEDDPLITVGDFVKLYSTRKNRDYYFIIIDITKNTVIVSTKNPRFKLLHGEKFNVRFMSANWPIRCCHYVLYVMAKYNLVNLVYPKINTNDYIVPEGDFEWVHKSVANNPEQKTAIINIINKSAHPAPYILFGPPGTGKTTTLVEAICQIRKQHRTKSILVCAPSNSAADEIARRLLSLLPNKDIFRMYATSKHWSTLDKKINPSSNFVDKEVLYLPKELFILKKIVITTLVTCTRLVQLRLRYDHFSYVFIDEASQSTEIESLIPLTIMNSKRKDRETVHAQMIIAGDPYQLGPLIRCRKIQHLIGKSLLQRLMEECEPYQKVNNKYNSRYITKLIRNYRSQEAILYTPNKLFYDGELKCCVEPIKGIIINSKWEVLLNRTFPIIFLAVKGEEQRALNKSVYNETEVEVITKCAKQLMISTFDNSKIEEKDIGIITPFRQQKSMIEKQLEKQNLKKITVGTVETFQGQEREIIIVSTVRTESFIHDGKTHIGFLSHPKRFNVALTRAKRLLIVVGDPSVLCIDEHWNTLWQYCEENNACVEYFEQM